MVRVDLHSDPDTEFARKRRQQHSAAVKAYDKQVKAKAAADRAAAASATAAAAAGEDEEKNGACSANSSDSSCPLPPSTPPKLLPKKAPPLPLPPPPPPPQPVCMVLASSLRPAAVPWIPPLVTALEALSWAPFVALSPLLWWANGGPTAVGGAGSAAGPAVAPGMQRVSRE